jgi:hypothetical protein
MEAYRNSQDCIDDERHGDIVHNGGHGQKRVEELRRSSEPAG